MAESWVRLWAGMTLNAKWQTIARKSGQRRSLVIAMFTHLLMIANESEPRGSLADADFEDIASALDEDEESIRAIWDALLGRAIDPETLRLTGWEKHQPAREDAITPTAKTAAERKREQRERNRSSRDVTHCHAPSRDVTHCHAPSRDVTHCHAPEADTEADTEAEVNPSGVAISPGDARDDDESNAPLDDTPQTRRGLVCRLLRQAGVADAAPHQLPDETWRQIFAKRTDEEIVEFARAKLAGRPGQRTGLRYLAPGLMEDPKPLAAPIAGARASPHLTREDSRRIASNTRLSDFRAACAAEQQVRTDDNDERTIDATDTRLLG